MKILITVKLLKTNDWDEIEIEAPSNWNNMSIGEQTDYCFSLIHEELISWEFEELKED